MTTHHNVNRRFGDNADQLLTTGEPEFAGATLASLTVERTLGNFTSDDIDVLVDVRSQLSDLKANGSPRFTGDISRLQNPLVAISGAGPFPLTQPRFSRDSVSWRSTFQDISPRRKSQVKSKESLFCLSPHDGNTNTSPGGFSGTQVEIFCRSATDGDYLYAANEDYILRYDGSTWSSIFEISTIGDIAYAVSNSGHILRNGGAVIGVRVSPISPHRYNIYYCPDIQSSPTNWTKAKFVDGSDFTFSYGIDTDDGSYTMGGVPGRWTFAQRSNGTLIASEYSGEKTGPKLYRSTDNGATWAEVNDIYETLGYPDDTRGQHCHKVYYSENTNAWIASYGDGENQAQLVSTDDGQNWSVFTTPDEQGELQVVGIIDHPTDPNAVLFGADEEYYAAKAVFDLSSDTFKWSPLDVGDGVREVTGFSFALGEDDGVVYLIDKDSDKDCSRGIYASIDGVHWSRVATLPDDAGLVPYMGDFYDGKMWLPHAGGIYSVSLPNLTPCHAVIAEAAATNQVAEAISNGTDDSVWRSGMGTVTGGQSDTLAPLDNVWECTPDDPSADIFRIYAYEPGIIGGLADGDVLHFQAWVRAKDQPITIAGQTYNGSSTSATGRYMVGTEEYTRIHWTHQYDSGTDTNIWPRIQSFALLGNTNTAFYFTGFSCFVDHPGDWQVGGTARTSMDWNYSLDLPATWSLIVGVQPSVASWVHPSGDATKHYIASLTDGTAACELYYDYNDNKFYIKGDNDAGTTTELESVSAQQYHRGAIIWCCITYDSSDHITLAVLNAGMENVSSASSTAFDALTGDGFTLYSGDKNGENQLYGWLNTLRVLPHAVDLSDYTELRSIVSDIVAGK